MTIDEFNALGPMQASNQLRLCCVAERWIDAMLQDRPYADAAIEQEKITALRLRQMTVFVNIVVASTYAA